MALQSPEDMILAVASSPYRTLDFFNAGTGEHLGRIPDLVAEPHEIATDVARRRMYVTHTYRSKGYKTGEPAHEVSVIDVDARALVELVDIRPFISPHDIEFSAANDEIYVSVERNEAGNGVVIIDPGTGTVTGHIPTPGENSHWLAASPDGQRCFVTHKEAPMLTVLDLPGRKLIDTVELPGGAEEVDVAPDGSYVYVVTPQQTPPAKPGATPSRVVKIDAVSLEIVGQVELDPAIVAIRATADGRVLVSRMHPGDNSEVAAMYADTGKQAPGTLEVIDAATMSVLGTVELDRMSFTVRASPDSRLAYVANIGAGTVSVVDLDRYKIVRTLDCTPDPQFGGTHGLSLIGANS